MVFVQMTDGKVVLIIEQANIDELRSGKPMFSPDRSVLVCFTADMEFTESMVKEALAANVLDAHTLAEIVDLSWRRKEATK